MFCLSLIFFFQAEDGIRDTSVTGVQTCALPISRNPPIGAREDRHEGTTLSAAESTKRGSLMPILSSANRRISGSGSDVARARRSEERRVGKGSRRRWERESGKEKEKRMHKVVE